MIHKNSNKKNIRILLGVVFVVLVYNDQRCKDNHPLSCQSSVLLVVSAADDAAAAEEACEKKDDIIHDDDNSEEVIVDNQHATCSIQDYIRKLTEKAFSTASATKREGLWTEILKLDTRNGNAMLQLGLLKMSSSDPAIRQDGAINYLGRVFDPNYVDIPIPMPSLQGIRLTMFLGRYHWEQKDFWRASGYFQFALSATQVLPSNNETSSYQICILTSLSTMLHPFPNSTIQADEMYDKYINTAKQFLTLIKQQHQNNNQQNTNTTLFDESLLSQAVPGAIDDPYVHCVLTIFQLSFYYRADIAEAANLHYQIASTVWPQLKYTSPNIDNNKLMTNDKDKKTCITRHIQLGIASGFLTPGSSVSADFGGVLQRLNRDIFNITYIHIKKEESLKTDPFVFRHTNDSFIEIARDTKQDIANGAWISRFYPTIGQLDLDILLYLDLTMNPIATRLSMARLAPVQANTHGHPVTSGVAAVDYFISWGAAELKYNIANTHYTEELVLLNSTVPHQYYEPRFHNGRSILDGGNFQDISKRSFFEQYVTPKTDTNIFQDEEGLQTSDHNDSVHWYTCMQKPHKFMPEMDTLLCDVLKADLLGILVLHQPDTQEMMLSLIERFKIAQCDMDRVYFVPALPHHQLLALYQVSTVILDSYPAGGCTTTREALELSKIVVTWPARLLGGRWSYAYYRMLNDDILNQHVIAISHEDYVKKAVQLGRDPTLRKSMEARIKASLHHLYRNEDAVRSWEEVLQRISPVEKQKTCP